MERATATNLAIARLTPLLAVVLRWDRVSMETLFVTADRRRQTASVFGGHRSAVGGR